MREIPAVDDDRVKVEIGPITGADGGKFTLRLRRIDFLPDDVQDQIQADCEALDVEHSLIMVATDLVETPVGTSVFWLPLLKPARAELIKAGVRWERVAPNGLNRDKFTIDNDGDGEPGPKAKKTLRALEKWADKPQMSLPRREKNAALAALKHVLTDEEYAKVAALTNGQVKAIQQDWQKQSAMSLGEFLASENS